MPCFLTLFPSPLFDCSCNSKKCAPLSLSQPRNRGFSSIPRFYRTLTILATVPIHPTYSSYLKMTDGSTRSAPRARTKLLAPACRRPPCLNADSVDKEIYILQLRERVLQQETAKLEAEERVVPRLLKRLRPPMKRTSSTKNYQVSCPRLLTPSVTTSGQYPINT